MAKKLLATLLAAVMALSAAAIPAFAAGKLGDVDNDGEITSGDARLALRASVQLESLTPEMQQRADIDKNGEVESSDARMILRASVRLEDLSRFDHTHEVAAWTPVDGDPESHSGVCAVCGETVTEKHTIATRIVKESTCTEPGEAEEYCSVCGYVIDTVEVPAAHKFVPVEGTEIPATCTENGSREVQCSVCGEKDTETIPAAHKPGPDATCTVPQTCTVCGETLSPMLGHVYVKNAAITVTKGIRCERCGEIGLPGFNDLVNVLKKENHVYSGFTYADATFDSKLDGTLKSLEGDLSEMMTPDMEDGLGYSSLERRIPVTDDFNLVGSDNVSELTEEDNVTIKLEQVSGVDFLASLPDAYEDPNGREIDLTGLKQTQLGNVFKVTVSFPEEHYGNGADNAKESAIAHLDSSASMITSMMSFDLLGGAAEEDDILSQILKFTGGATSNLEVVYYFDSLTNAPIAAVYDSDVLLEMKITMFQDDEEKGKIIITNVIAGSGTIKVDYMTKSYFFFDDYFNF